MKKPMATITRAYLVTLKATIWAVKVLPMLAPMITPTDRARVMNPAEMNPVTSTVVNEEELSTAVTKAPVRVPGSW